jgi:hypothetical protein
MKKIEYTFNCQKCNSEFTRTVTLDKATRDTTKKEFHECSKCKKVSTKKQKLSDSVIEIELRKRELL